MTTYVLEGPGGLPGLKQSPSATTSKPFIFNSLVTFNGGTSGVTTSVTVPSNSTGSNANAFSIAKAGSNYAFNIDTSASSAVTGINIASAAAGSGLVITTTSTGTNEALSISSKGTGVLNLNSAANGNVNFANGSFISTSGAFIVKSTSANSLDVGANGATNPVLQVNASTSSVATGLSLTGAAAAAGMALAVISTGTNENLTVAAKGSGTITLNPATTATAGGAAGDGVMYGSIGVGLFTGTGAPTFSAMNGSIYTDSNATTTTTRIYVNKSGAGTAGTTWTALTTAA